MAGETQAVEPTQQGGETPHTDQPQNGTAPGAPTGNAGGQAQAGAPGRVEELPEWAQGLVKELRKENAARRKAEEEATKAAQAAQEADLAQRQEWQTLAEKRKAELEALQPKAAAYEALAAELSAEVRAEIAKWPAEVRGMAPDEGADLAALRAWAKKARPLAEQLAAKPATPGNGPAPRPAAGTQAEEAARAQFARQYQTF